MTQEIGISPTATGTRRWRLVTFCFCFVALALFTAWIVDRSSAGDLSKVPPELRRQLTNLQAGTVLIEYLGDEGLRLSFWEPENEISQWEVPASVSKQDPVIYPTIRFKGTEAHPAAMEFPCTGDTRLRLTWLIEKFDSEGEEGGPNEYDRALSLVNLRGSLLDKFRYWQARRSYSGPRCCN